MWSVERAARAESGEREGLCVAVERPGRWTRSRLRTCIRFRIVDTAHRTRQGLELLNAKKKREEKNKRIWDLREKRHKGVEKGDKAFLESLYYLFEGTTRKTNRQTSKRQQGPIAQR